MGEAVIDEGLQLKAFAAPLLGPDISASQIRFVYQGRQLLKEQLTFGEAKICDGATVYAIHGIGVH